MKKTLTKKLLYFTIASFLSLLLANLSLAESLSLGNMSYGQINTPYLTRTVSRSASFVRAVGGVAFEAVAIGDNGLKVTKLSYNPLANDGSRLEILLTDASGHQYKVIDDIFDWQLIPIARFADSPNGAAMTLFGDASDEQLGKEITDADGRVINYHLELQDTLVGLRLFQADILIFQDNGADLFRNKSGQYVMGAGEGQHDPGANRARFQRMQLFLDAEKKSGSRYESYVVGDLGQDVNFGISNNKFYIVGKPYWWMWVTPEQYRVDEEQLQIDTLVIAALSVLDKDSTNQETPSEDELNFSKKIVSVFEEEDGDYEALEQRLNKYEKIEAISTLPVEQNVDLSNRTSRKVIELDGINPIIYENLTTVMCYSALFRHAKQINSAGYSKFLDSMKSVDILPKVTTPTVQYGVVH